MKLFKIKILVLALSLTHISNAQEEHKDNKQVDKETYYLKRAKEDAKYEQQFVTENEKEEEEFWEEQRQYEKDLKKRDRKAYRAYMRGKRDAYVEHYEHCDHHCNHGDHYYHHASFYYYRYDGYYYHRYPQRSNISTRVRISMPRVGLGVRL